MTARSLMMTDPRHSAFSLAGLRSTKWPEPKTFQFLGRDGELLSTVSDELYMFSILK